MAETARGTLEGYAPVVEHGQGNPEAVKYGTLWAMPEYRAVSPGEHLAQLFLSHAHPSLGSEVIDFGCGTGRGGLMLAVLGSLKVTLVDFVRNCLDADIQEMLMTQAHALTFVKADLEQPLPMAAPYGVCFDVMEHIPEMRVGKVLDNILKAAQHVFFSISTTKDRCGALIDQDLHLTVHDYHWWLQKFNQRDCVIHWSNEEEGACYFYVSAWSDGSTIVQAARLNVSDEQINANVKANIEAGWQQVQPHETNEVEVMILGGGPSLPDHLETIRQMRADGVKLITLNASYNWALEQGLTPSAQIMVDARPFNARFTRPAIEGCKYLLASQCDPSVFEGLPKDRTYLWHTSEATIRDILEANYKAWWPVPSCSTVLLTGLLLLRMLGFRKFHLFGCDSCISADQQHHAYKQTENDGELAIPVTVTGGRVFWCSGWMVGQAQSMLDLVKFMGDEIELEIYGDGLLAHILKTGAEMDIADTRSSKQ